jgi:predicted kinase
MRGKRVASMPEPRPQIQNYTNVAKQIVFDVPQVECHSKLRERSVYNQFLLFFIRL